MYTIIRTIILVSLLAPLAACGTPTPRGYAYSGVAPGNDRTVLNSPYYMGSDPSFLQHGKSRGP